MSSKKITNHDDKVLVTYNSDFDTIKSMMLGSSSDPSETPFINSHYDEYFSSAMS